MTEPRDLDAMTNSSQFRSTPADGQHDGADLREDVRKKRIYERPRVDVIGTICALTSGTAGAPGDNTAGSITGG